MYAMISQSVRGLLRGGLSLGWLLAAGLAAIPGWAAPPGDPAALALLHKSEALMRGGGSEGVYRVSIVRPDWRRELRLRSIDDAARDRYRLELLAPHKLKGTVFFKRGERLSMYLPKLQRDVAISPAMMLDPWMGSDFTNQDLIESSALIDQYTHRVAGRDGRVTRIVSTPKPDAAVSWARLEQRIRDDGLPLEIRYESSRPGHGRVLRFEDPKRLGGRLIPSRWVMQPLAHPNQHTTIEVEQIRFGVHPDDGLFQPPGPVSKGSP
jgi:hypothetical protein